MSLPLEGIRILDLTRMIAGPFGSMILADQGADVIKIEMPETGDPERAAGTPDEFVLGEGLHFLSVNRNKKSVTLDLKRPEAREVFYDLVKVSDVVFDNFRPAVMAKLGCDYEKLNKINPRIICCSLSGFGSTGPYRDRPAWDVAIQGMGGVMSVTGEKGGRPLRVGFAIGDTVPSLWSVIGILTALQGREKTGKGSYVDLGMLDCLSSLLIYYTTRYTATGFVPPLLGGRHINVSPWGSYRTRDNFIVLGVPGDQAWGRFCPALGLHDLEKDPRFYTNNKRVENAEELTVALEAFLTTNDTAHWLNLLQDVDVVCSPVHSVDRVVSDPQIVARDMIVEVEHPVIGKYRMMGNPIKGTMIPKQRLESPPILGEDTKEVLSGLLGYSEEKIESLRASKAV
ncbi:MAG: CaiB/BaiF CoA-transferase family protein [Dehalococcoidia bacterium]|nr:CaiB/BaiF CoA-transferase family protein [Dehalococcoidia bacterium]